MLFSQKFIDVARRGRAADAEHVSRNVTSYGMSETARRRYAELLARRSRTSHVIGIKSVSRTQSEAIVTVIPGSYIGYYKKYGE